MPYMSGEDFTVHADDCPDRSDGWMPLSDLPDEVTSLEDLNCDCWAAYDSITDV